jgi:hypothetical protein
MKNQVKRGTRIRTNERAASNFLIGRSWGSFRPQDRPETTKLRFGVAGSNPFQRVSDRSKGVPGSL